MSVQIHINGENAAEAVRELADLASHLSLVSSHLGSAEAPAVAVTPSYPVQQAAPASPAASPAPFAPQPGYGQFQQPVQTQYDPNQYQAPGAAQVPVGQPPVQQPLPVSAPTGVPVANAQEFSFDQIGVAATSLIDADPNKQQLLVDYLRGQFGANSLMELKKEQYGAFATYLRSLGARI